jgi:hypothetical protein
MGAMGDSQNNWEEDGAMGDGGNDAGMEQGGNDWGNGSGDANVFGAAAARPAFGNEAVEIAGGGGEELFRICFGIIKSKCR